VYAEPDFGGQNPAKVYRERLVKASQYSISGDDYPNPNRLPSQSDPRQKELIMKIQSKYAVRGFRADLDNYLNDNTYKLKNLKK
jgi:hypothetical protein